MTQLGEMAPPPEDRMPPAPGARVQNVDIAAKAALLGAPSVTHSAPFVVWPVARREYYAVLGFAMCVPIVWGMIIFGWQAYGVLVLALAGAAVAYTFLKLAFPDSRRLQFTHVAASALIVVALSYPLSPWPLMAAAGVLVALLAFLLGGPGRGRPPAALLVPILLALAVTAPVRWPLLARNRLLFGNALLTKPVNRYRWPRSTAINGAQGVLLPRPGRSVDALYTRIYRKPTGHRAWQRIRAAMVFKLPTPEMLFAGVVPGRVGCVGVLFIIAAGLYLAYRHMLRTGACVLFLLSVLLGLLVWPLTPQALAAQGWASFGGVWALHPAPAITLSVYELLSGDFMFAAVFLLALPGVMPITPIARRLFLLSAGLLAAAAHRANLPLPAATLSLLILQPIAPWLDKWLHQRSWLER